MAASRIRNLARGWQTVEDFHRRAGGDRWEPASNRGCKRIAAAWLDGLGCLTPGIRGPNHRYSPGCHDWIHQGSGRRSPGRAGLRDNWSRGYIHPDFGFDSRLRGVLPGTGRRPD